MATLNGWLCDLYGFNESKSILKNFNEENGIASSILSMNGTLSCHFFIDHNHYGSSFEFFFNQLHKLVEAENKEMHGLIYVQDYEDQSYHDVFQVWVVAKGKITKAEDTHLSPFSEKVGIYDDD